MLFLMSFFSLVIVIVGRPIGSEYNEMWPIENPHTRKFYIEISGLFNNPLLMETKAHCAYRGYLQKKFLTKQSISEILPMFSTFTTQLPPMEIAALNGDPQLIAKALKLNKIKIKNTPMRNFKGYAINNENYEDVDGTPIWTHFDFTSDQQAVTNVTIQGQTIWLEAITQHRSLIPWSFAKKPVTDDLIEDIQKWQEKRIETMDKSIYIQWLDNLFYEDRLSSNLYTREIEEFAQKAYLEWTIEEVFKNVIFEVIGCAEKPWNKGSTIVLAVRTMVPNQNA